MTTTLPATPLGAPSGAAQAGAAGGAAAAAAPLMQAYRQADTALRVRQAKVCCVLSMLLVPACTGMDYFVYPELIRPMFVVRVVCVLALLPVLALLYTPLGRRHVWLLGHAPPGLPALAICWMIYVTEGAHSPYYAGLNIVMVGVILLIPYRFGEALLICGLVMACYGAACWLHRAHPPAIAVRTGQTRSAATFVNNLYFLGMTSVLAVTGCHLNAVRRFTDFRLRHELDSNNRRLQTTIVKLQETEVQLVQSEKMNALGKLSAGLLHEVNNPLNYTFMALQIAKAEAAGNAGLQETLGDINEGMERIKSVISDLRGFAHPSKQNDEETFKLTDALTTALRLTAHELQGLVVGQYDVEGVVCVGSKTQIVHVLMNMLVNSMHAVADPALGRPPRIEVRCGDGGDGRAEIAVLDNGPGIAAADLPRLLDPFFTTKEPGKGTGLGLSICNTIVKNHGGEIRITTEQGKWTRVAFDLPLAPKLAKVTV